VLILVRHAMPAIGPDRRFEEGIVEQLASAGDRPLLVATHGMAMTVWLTARPRLADPGSYWEDLRFPDAHRVDTDDETLRRITDLP
jgi:hypothetical protein